MLCFVFIVLLLLNVISFFKFLCKYSVHQTCYFFLKFSENFLSMKIVSNPRWIFKPFLLLFLLLQQLIEKNILYLNLTELTASVQFQSGLNSLAKRLFWNCKKILSQRCRIGFLIQILESPNLARIWPKDWITEA